MAAPLYFRTHHLLVCGHTNCAQRGSRLLYQALWNALEQGKLAYYKAGGTVRLTQSGCLGACTFGPVLCAYRQRAAGQGLEEAWYAAADLPLALALAGSLQRGEALPTDRRYGPPNQEPAD